MTCLPKVNFVREISGCYILLNIITLSARSPFVVSCRGRRSCGGHKAKANFRCSINERRLRMIIPARHRSMAVSSKPGVGPPPATNRNGKKNQVADRCNGSTKTLPEAGSKYRKTLGFRKASRGTMRRKSSSYPVRGKFEPVPCLEFRRGSRACD